MTIPKDRDPISLFGEWYDGAQDCGMEEPSAVALATADIKGRPSVRMVLLKDVDQQGFVFYTNLESRKGTQLADNAHAALCFHWMPLNRQVRVEGSVEPVSSEEADAYFASRPRDAQIGAWASKQSQAMEGMLVLERSVAKYALRFAVGKVARPKFWSGFRLRPNRIEFWQRGSARLHERLLFERVDEGWATHRLFP